MAMKAILPMAALAAGAGVLFVAMKATMGGKGTAASTSAASKPAAPKPAAPKPAASSSGDPLLKELIGFWNGLVQPAADKENATQFKAFSTDHTNAIAALGKMKMATDSPSDFLKWKNLGNTWASRLGEPQFT